MGISEKKQQLSGREPKKVLSSPPKPKSLFEEKEAISRPEFREILRKAPSQIPGAGGRMYSWQERVNMEKELFPYERFSSHISEIEVKRRLRELRSERHKAETGEERLNIDRKIRFLEKVTGVKPY